MFEWRSLYRQAWLFLFLFLFLLLPAWVLPRRPACGARATWNPSHLSFFPAVKENTRRKCRKKKRKKERYCQIGAVEKRKGRRREKKTTEKWNCDGQTPKCQWIRTTWHPPLKMSSESFCWIPVNCSSLLISARRSAAAVPSLLHKSQEEKVETRKRVFFFYFFFLTLLLLTGRPGRN